MKIFLERHSTVPGSQSLPIRFHFVTAVMMFTLVISGGGLAAQQSPTTSQPSHPSTLKTNSSPGESSPRTAFETVRPLESSAKTTVAQESTSSRAGVPGENPTNHADLSAMDASILSEIKAIRAQLGGGVAKQLEGVLMHPGAPGTPQTTKADNDGSERLLLENVFDDEINQLSGIQVSTQKPIEPPADGSPSSANRFRMAARYLDLAAAELEEVSRFVDADQLRQHAQRLRLRVR